MVQGELVDVKQLMKERNWLRGSWQKKMYERKDTKKHRRCMKEGFYCYLFQVLIEFQLDVKESVLLVKVRP